MAPSSRVARLGCLVLLLSSFVHCAPETATAATAANTTTLASKIEAASEAQEFGEKIEVVAGEVSVAPAVKLSAGTGDIDTSGPCSEDIQIFCPQVKPGAAHIAECVSNQIADEKEGKSEFTAKVTEGCKTEILNFKMSLSTNINFDVQMATACKADAAKFCQYTKDLDFPGKVIACLREKKPKLSGKCRNQITNAQMAAAEDYRLDAQLYEACKPDAANVCADVKPGSGRVNACLRENRPKVSWDCQEELFRADVENADDVRLSVRLFRTCIKEKQTFCGVVAPGNARAKDCLEQNRDKPGFGEECKAMLEKMMAERARDFRLDVRLREQCTADLENLCSFEKDSLQAVANGDSRVVECLQDFREELMNPECKKAVQSTMERGASDIRFDVSLAEACYDDRQKYCGSVKPGSARVIRCLQDRRDLLKEDCRATLFDHEVRISESIDFNLPMKQACTAEIGKFCQNIPTGHARVIRCLQENKGQADFSEQCKKEVISFEHSQNRDYRLNYRLATACEDDIYALCHESCDMYSGRACGGRVLRCLTERKEELKAEACKAEVFYFLKMEVTDYGNDIILAEACRDDVDKLCKDVKAGDGRVHECLRSPKNRKELSIACRNEELKLEILETSNIELRPSLKRQCADERQVFCKDIKTGRARVFRCLIQNLGKVDFGANCKSEIIRKLQRRQQNWKLDVNLRTQCKSDAERLCADVDHDSDHADVVRCLMGKKDELVESCSREVGRAAHMSLYVWQPQSALSKVCDADINTTCTSASPMMANFPGKVLACLERQIKSTPQTGTNKKFVSPECKAFVDIAEPPDEKLEYDNNLRGVAVSRFKSTLTSAGIWDKRRGVTVTGYSALAAFTALCTVIILGLYTLYKRYRGIKDGYTMVLKSGDV